MKRTSRSTSALHKAEIAVIGEALIDVVIDDDGTEHEYVGGSPANVALGLGRLGYPVTLYTQFGADAHGRLIERRMAQSGVDVIQGGDRNILTSRATVTLDTAQVPHYDFQINWDAHFDVATPQVLHTGSLGAYLEPGAHEVDRILHELDGRTTITLDPNLRPSLMTADQAKSRLERLVGFSTVIKVSDEDLAWLYPGVAPDDILAEWRTLGAAFTVLTRGAQGASAWSSHANAEVPGILTAVVDTVGAGDAFMAALLDAVCTLDLVQGAHRSALASLDDATIATILNHANRAASIAVSRAGAQPPLRDELGVCAAPQEVQPASSNRSRAAAT